MNGSEIFTKIKGLLLEGENTLLTEGEVERFFLYENPAGTLSVIDYQRGLTYMLWDDGVINSIRTGSEGQDDANPQIITGRELTERMMGMEEFERVAVPEPA